jgi:adenylate kinase family enzyme
LNRVLVIGPGGAGKSVFAVRLAERTGLPLLHLDMLYWQPGWVEPTKDEWSAQVERLVAGERWIMDGNYGGTLTRRLAACDTAIFLDASRWLCLWRVIKRRWMHRGRARPNMTPGCDERLSAEFLWWIWTYPSRRRPKILRMLGELRAGQTAVILRGPREIEHFLEHAAAARA